MNRKNFRKVLFLCGVLGCSALSAENYTRVGTGNWSDAAWTVNGTADQSWVDGNQAGITVAADNAFTLDAGASVTGIAFTGLESTQSAAFSGAKTLTFTGDAQTFEVADGTLNFANQLAGTAILKTGAGTLNITQIQTAFDGITVQEGTLQLSVGEFGTPCMSSAPVTILAGAKLLVSHNFGIGSGMLTADGGNVHLTGTQQYLNHMTLKNGATVTAVNGTSGGNDDNSFCVGYNYAGVSDATLHVTGTSASAISAGITMVRGSGSSDNYTVTVDSTGDESGVDLTISGKIFDYSGLSGLVLKKAGAGVLKLSSNASTWAGGINLTAGTVQISATQALGYGQLNLGETASVLQLLSTANGGAGTYSVKQLTGSGTVSVLGDAATLKVGSVTNASSQVLSGDSTFSGTFSSAVSLEKTGTGTLTLEKSGGNGTIAGVSVTEGTLRLAGSGLAPTGSRYGYFGSTTIEVSGTGTLRAESWNIQNTPVHVTGENAELYIAGANYANRVTLTDGADVSGTEFRMGWWTSDSPILTVDGTGTGSVISNNIFMLLKNGSSITELDLTVEDTGAMTAGNADLTITSKITDHSGYEGLKIVKSGAGTLKITNTQNNWAGGMKIVDGLVILSAGAAGNGTYTVEAGGALAPAPTSDETYVSLSKATFVEGSNLELLIDSPTEFSRFVLDTVPTYDINNGFIELVVAEDANLGSSETFKVSNAYPGGSAENLDLESWLGSDFRYEWNLNWDAASSALLLSRDANAIPEPAAWVLLILGVLGVGVVRKSGKKEKF